MDRELDRILAEGYLDGLTDATPAQIRSLRDECQALETQLSFLRRLVQGRHDIATGEIGRRSHGGSAADVSSLVDSLPAILSDRIHAPGPGRMPALLEPGDLSGRLVDELGDITEAASLDTPGEVSDGDLTRAAEQLAALELEVSALRRSLFDRIDTLQAELTRRYRTGETTVDDLLGGKA